MKISKGNSKIGKVPNVSLLPCKDCGNVPCKSQCYAAKALNYSPDARRAWSHNSRQARNNPTAYFNALADYLAKHNPAWFRWHVAGDILGQDYLNRMIKIARQFPGTRFLAFTKMHNLDYSDLPANLVIVASMWPTWGNPDAVRSSGLPIAWMQDGTETRIPVDAIECPGSCENCMMCWNLPKLQKEVYFRKH